VFSRKSSAVLPAHTARKTGRRYQDESKTSRGRAAGAIIRLKTSHGQTSRTYTGVAMANSSPNKVTQLLLDWSNGKEAALDQLMPLVDGELHRLARHYMRHERVGHTLQTTAVVNEAYLRLIDQKNVHWKNRAHFFALSAQLMRRILIDHARKRKYAKRGGDAQQVSLDEAMIVSRERGADLIALDDA